MQNIDQQRNGGDEERVIGEGGEKLRRHNDVETASHSDGIILRQDKISHHNCKVLLYHIYRGHRECAARRDYPARRKYV